MNSGTNSSQQTPEHSQLGFKLLTTTEMRTAKLIDFVNGGKGLYSDVKVKIFWCVFESNFMDAIKL